ncbi:Hsp70 nucleotide exchange factor FES1 [Sparassis crispa]|uniref:Hsp70 nucleotide exchange factor FES1 n=1 Tax=Sparassis crispa TaxID=139825 RepID=A0A401GXM8_9APHY|nr:Hsp70 nucleotide exchange factor FES1 [Sparassis crispa]GBE86961.1 Hsp70 nucleotide exchange factor FES1 [Sparassis crispa]
MESLLRWGIEHSGSHDASQPAPQPRKDLDPGIIDAILGKSDAQLMKDALTIAVDEKRDEDERVQALDDFEMLVEQIDNANNIEKMKMWDPLHGLLIASSSPESVKMQTLWVIGTAVQNNPSAQISYLVLSPMPTLLAFLSPEVKSPQVRSKAVYALSGLLKLNAPAVRQLEEAGGWEILKAALEDSDITVRRKTAFLVNSLLVPMDPIIRPSQQPGRPSASSTAPHTPSTSVIAHPTGPPPDSAPAAAPVHPNSHATMLSDPTSFSTSPATFAAFQERGMLQALISSLTSPTPHGADGETEGDPDFEEKVVRSLHTYVTSCHGHFTDGQRSELAAYVKEQTTKTGGDSRLAQRWGFTVDEVKALRHAVE